MNEWCRAILVGLVCANPACIADYPPFETTADTSGGTTTTAGAVRETTGGSSESTASVSASSSTSSSGASESSTGEPVLPFSGSLRVMTFNVLCSLCGSSSEFDSWDERVPFISDTITRHDPDLIGLQEFIYPAEVEQILEGTRGYAAVFFEEDGDIMAYPDATVFYREDVFELVERGAYWLSPTPDEPHSRGFGDGFQLARLVVWTVLQRKGDGAELFFATTHFDNNSPSQELSAPLALERTEPFVGARPVIFVGDFNSRPESEAYGILTGGDPFTLENAFDLAPPWTMDSNQDPVPDYDTSRRIDHVFVAGGAWTASEWTVDTWIYGENDRYVSDHFAIVAEVSLR